MFGMQIENAFDGCLPGLKSLLGQAVDQVEIQVSETCFACGCDSFDDGEEIVRAFQHA